MGSKTEARVKQDTKVPHSSGRGDWGVINKEHTVGVSRDDYKLSQLQRGPGRLAVINGTMNSAVYQKILKENVQPSVGELKLKQTWVLQQDNDPKHTSRSTSEWLENNNGKTLEWPSPDLSPIEMLWADLKKADNGMICGLASPQAVYLQLSSWYRAKDGSVVHVHDTHGESTASRRMVLGRQASGCVDFGKQERVHTSITINGAAVERVSSFKLLGVHITEELTWTEHTTRVGKTAQQRLFFLRRLGRFGMDPRTLRTFYTCTVESILTGSITTWYRSCTAIEWKALQRVVRTAQYITGVQLSNLLDLYTSRCLRKTRRVLKDPTHPSHCLFSQLPSGRRFRIPADGAVEVEVEGHQTFLTRDNKPSILVLTTVPPHTDSLGISTKTKAGLVTEDDPLPF
ncbi:hypothetical protein NFI96_004997 [Prochilodus magdalenae]|nr:hypothetical protein NFI96_004997 [Prochilodus magdalenae]